MKSSRYFHFKILSRSLALPSLSQTHIRSPIMQSVSCIVVLAQIFSSSTQNSISVSVKLNHNNYFLWRAQMEGWILAYGLEGFIDGSHSQPSRFRDSTNSISIIKFLSWARLNSMLKGCVFSALCLARCPSMCRASLQKLFSGLTLNLVFSDLKSQLQHLRKENMSVFLQVKEISYHLDGTVILA